MENIEEIMAKLEQKNEELKQALDFKIEENAALKTIIKNMDEESNKFKDQVTN